MCGWRNALSGSTLLTRYLSVVDVRFGDYAACNKGVCGVEYQRRFTVGRTGQCDDSLMPPEFRFRWYSFPADAACASGAKLGAANCTFETPQVDRSVTAACVFSALNRTPALRAACQGGKYGALALPLSDAFDNCSAQKYP